MEWLIVEDGVGNATAAIGGFIAGRVDASPSVELIIALISYSATVKERLCSSNYCRRRANGGDRR